jgi:hypothetical protein
MTEREREATIQALRDFSNEARLAKAAEELHRHATKEDLPWLMEMLKDRDFVVREAAAWPVSELCGPAALPELFAALQRGEDEGQDNDGLVATLIELVAADRNAGRRALEELAKASDPRTRAAAVWLLEFCAIE